MAQSRIEDLSPVVKKVSVELTPGRGGHVFKTTNALAGTVSWTNISPPEDRPENVIILDSSTPRTVYVGSDGGVWRVKDFPGQTE